MSSSMFPQLIEFGTPSKTLDVSITDSGGTAVDLNGANFELYLRRYGQFPEVAQYTR